MSFMQPSTPAAAAVASSSRASLKKRPRHFWDGPEPADDQKQRAEHVSPVARLYRHALESIFAFLSLAELNLVLRVSRPWSSAVRSMKSIRAALVGLKPWLVGASSLAHHVSSIGDLDVSSLPELTSSDLFILSHQLGSLSSLACLVKLPQPSRLFFGLPLQTLHLHVAGKKRDVVAVNDTIAAISKLPQLTDLTLLVPRFYAALNFAPLAAASMLRDLELQTGYSRPPTPQHLDELRMLPHLRKMSIDDLTVDELVSLLRVPHSLQWQQIHEVDEIDEDEAVALSTLPTLTKLDACGCCTVAFLPSLTRLRSLDLHVHVADSVHLVADIVAGLSCCSELTDLALSADDVTAQPMSQILPQLPLLRSLMLTCCHALESLSFLSDCPPLAQSLQSLRLHGCCNAALRSTELKHVMSLKHLTSLDIWRSFAEPLAACSSSQAAISATHSQGILVRVIIRGLHWFGSGECWRPGRHKRA